LVVDQIVDLPILPGHERWTPLRSNIGRCGIRGRRRLRAVDVKGPA
jgi:hypothetical protein